jgi:hypothetical protein
VSGLGRLRANGVRVMGGLSGIARPSGGEARRSFPRPTVPSRHTAEADWHVHANTCHIPHVPLTALAATSDNSTSPVRQPRCRGRVRPSVTLLSSNTASSTTMRDLSRPLETSFACQLILQTRVSFPFLARHREEDKGFTRKALHACLHHSPRIQLRAFA